nr:uncharacterized protein LOC129048470 [Pongo abelii]
MMGCSQRNPRPRHTQAWRLACGSPGGRKGFSGWSKAAQVTHGEEALGGSANPASTQARPRCAPGNPLGAGWVRGSHIKVPPQVPGAPRCFRGLQGGFLANHILLQLEDPRKAELPSTVCLSLTQTCSQIPWGRGLRPGGRRSLVSSLWCSQPLPLPRTPSLSEVAGSVDADPNRSFPRVISAPKSLLRSLLHPPPCQRWSSFHLPRAFRWGNTLRLRAARRSPPSAPPPHSPRSPLLVPRRPHRPPPASRASRGLCAGVQGALSWDNGRVLRKLQSGLTSRGEDGARRWAERSYWKTYRTALSWSMPQGRKRKKRCKDWKMRKKYHKLKKISPST